MAPLGGILISIWFAVFFRICLSLRFWMRFILHFLLQFCSSKVHDLPGVLMHGNSTCHGCRGPVLGPTWQVWPLPWVVLLLDQVVTCAESHQVRVVGWGRDGDGASASDVGVTELEKNKKIRFKVVCCGKYRTKSTNNFNKQWNHCREWHDFRLNMILHFSC